MNPLIIRYGGYQKFASIHNQAARFFGGSLTRKLGDRIAFQLEENVMDRGRKSGDLPAMVESGELSCCYISTVRFTAPVPEFKVFELPFVVRNRRSLWAALDGALGELFRQRMRDTTSLRLLGLWDNGFRHITNGVRTIRTPADCRGLRIRTQMSELHGEVFRALGFEPIAADVKEFVEQIANGRFQAQDNPLTNIYNFGVHRHHCYITLTGHLFGVSAFICNDAHFRSWPREVQEAVAQAAREATVLQHELAAAEDDAILAKLDPRENEVIRLEAVECAEFVAAVQPVIAKYRHEFDPQLLEQLAAA